MKHACICETNHYIVKSVQNVFHVLTVYLQADKITMENCLNFHISVWLQKVDDICFMIYARCETNYFSPSPVQHLMQVLSEKSWKKQLQLKYE